MPRDISTATLLVYRNALKEGKDVEVRWNEYGKFNSVTSRLWRPTLEQIERLLQKKTYGGNSAKD